MNFELKLKNRKIDNSEIIKDLQDVANRLNLESLSMAEYDLYGQFCSSTVRRRFGTWNKALMLANLQKRNTFYSDQDVIDNLYNVWVQLGRQPGRRDMDNRNISNVSSSVYLAKYGTWNNALKSFITFINDDEHKNEKSENIQIQNNNRHKTSRDVNMRLRFLVMQRDKFKCVLCGASPAKDPNITLQIDHIKPYSKGGETQIDNLQTLCSVCNLGKGNIER